MRCSVTSTVLSTAWRNGVLSLDQDAPAATQRLRDKLLGVRSDHGVRYIRLGPGLIDEGEAASTEMVPPSSGRLCGSRNGPARLHPGFFAAQPGHHEATGSGSGVPGHEDWGNLSVNSSGR
jgi:hypothetical protein